MSLINKAVQLVLVNSVSSTHSTAHSRHEQEQLYRTRHSHHTVRCCFQASPLTPTSTLPIND